MEWKKLLKPTWKKITLFFLLFLLIPFPLAPYFGEDISFLPLTAPFALIFTISILLVEQPAFSSLSEFLIYIVVPILYPFILYIVSSWIISYIERRNR